MTERERSSDAELILSVVRATADWQQSTNLDAIVKPLRELIWAVWEWPRLPRPLVRGKYPASVPWSPGARRAFRADRTCRLVLEHVTPASVIVRDLIRQPPANRASLVRTLRRRLEHVVIAPEENRALSAAGVGWSLPKGSNDPWSRYELIGLRRESFRPLPGRYVGPSLTSHV